MNSPWILELVPEWSEEAACIGMWETFDQGTNEQAAAICWQSCPVRSECLIATLKSEAKDSRVFGTLAVYGVRGGYTSNERRQIHESIAEHGYEILETL